MKPLKQVLIDARALITPEANWTQTYLARDKYNHPIPPTHPNAACWCMYGALIHQGLTFGQLSRGIPGVYEFKIGNYNNTHTHAEVLALLDELINQNEITQASSD